MFSLPWFQLHLLSYSVQCWLAWKQRSVLPTAPVQRQWGLACWEQNKDEAGQGIAWALVQPSKHPWASCVPALCCVLFAQGMRMLTPSQAQHSSHPAHPRRGCDTAEAAGGLHGGKDAGGLHGAERGRCCSTFHSGMPAQTSVLGSLGTADVLWLSFSSELFSLLQKKNVESIWGVTAEKNSFWTRVIKRSGW